MTFSYVRQFFSLLDTGRIQLLIGPKAQKCCQVIGPSKYSKGPRGNAWRRESSAGIVVELPEDQWLGSWQEQEVLMFAKSARPAGVPRTAFCSTGMVVRFCGGKAAGRSITD